MRLFLFVAGSEGGLHPMAKICWYDCSYLCWAAKEGCIQWLRSVGTIVPICAYLCWAAKDAIHVHSPGREVVSTRHEAAAWRSAFIKHLQSDQRESVGGSTAGCFLPRGQVRLVHFQHSTITPSLDNSSSTLSIFLSSLFSRCCVTLS